MAQASWKWKKHLVEMSLMAYAPTVKRSKSSKSFRNNDRNYVATIVISNYQGREIHYKEIIEGREECYTELYDSEQNSERPKRWPDNTT